MKKISSPNPATKPSRYFTDSIQNAKGRVGWILLWALGVPIPVLLILYVLRGCT